MPRRRLQREVAAHGVAHDGSACVRTARRAGFAQRLLKHVRPASMRRAIRRGRQNFGRGHDDMTSSQRIEKLSIHAGRIAVGVQERQVNSRGVWHEGVGNERRRK